MLLVIKYMEFSTEVEVSMKFSGALMQSRKMNQGFTLIELVVVIVILGVLAATVAPKFINLTADAHTATLEAVKGSLEGASALVYSKSIVAGNQNQESGTITLSDGVPLLISFGYPIVPRSTLVEAYWRRLINLSDEFAITSNSGGTLIIYPKELEDTVFATSSCAVTYNQSNSANGLPTITLFNCT